MEDKKVLKLQIIVGEEFAQTTKTMYFDVDKINGFYVSDPEIVDGKEVRPIMIFSQGEFIAFTPDPRLERFLTEEFVQPSKLEL